MPRARSSFALILACSMGAGVLLAASSNARAADPAPPPESEPADPETPADALSHKLGDGVPANLSHLIFDDGRRPAAEPPTDPKTPQKIDIRVELQGRIEHDSELPLEPPASDPSLTRLGQRWWGTEWVRLNFAYFYKDLFRVVVQGDLIPFWTFGDLARGVGADGDWARDSRSPSFGRLRYAYAEYKSPIGLFRVGQMGSHWGLGLVANDGDHRRLFGDYRNGTIVERVAFATKPAGEKSPFVIAIAGDAVVQDDTTKWLDGDRTYQAVGAAFYEKGPNFAGIYAVRRWQNLAHDEGKIRVWVFDAALRGAIPVGETGDVFAYLGAEGATILGTTDAIRTTPEFNTQKIRSFGGAANVGVVKRAVRDGETFGSIAVQLDGGYTGSDSNPYDGTIKRFTFDSNYQVGLVLFPFVMHFMTARIATDAVDPVLSGRPSPGSRFFTSHGGVFGAQYVNPTIVLRPTPWFDVKAGVLVAVATGDVVDPYRTALQGSARNFLGGNSHARDLGVEIDWGFEYRLRLRHAITIQLGMQAGVLFPGHAFDDANGRRMLPQSVLQGRLGVPF